MYIDILQGKEGLILLTLYICRQQGKDGPKIITFFFFNCMTQAVMKWHNEFINLKKRKKGIREKIKENRVKKGKSAPFRIDPTARFSSLDII